MLTRAPRGTRDILPQEANRWQYVEGIIRECCLVHGYGEIRLPLFEHTELFQRGVGEATDIVEKEMYTFKDRGGRSITLRPEATAPTVRAYLEHSLYVGPQPVKMYYVGPMFRYDRPQAGRYRQFDQFGIEAIGARDATMDAEVIAVALDLYSRLGLMQLEVQLNSIGCPSCRQDYRQALLSYLYSHKDELCTSCVKRMERNPLRVLDCKEESCRAVTDQAPRMLKYLCPECKNHFRIVQQSLVGIGAKYVINPTLVRGLDYYTKTVFEITWSGLGEEIAICGGGRYDGLVEECGGPPTPAVGFAMGMDRLLLALDQTGIRVPDKNQPVAYIVTLSPEDNQTAFAILTHLRRAGIASDKDYRETSLRAQFKAADRRQAQFTILVGGDELTRDAVAVRNMVTGEQREVEIDGLTTYLREGV
ncbi:MAG TPA: histidine--tRNA ligase [bacterium]|nr:histidine--tRNA ligase [bacterium]